jgi:hypothetical protein
MSNVIQFSITGDTNAEQVAGRAKAAVSGLDKQLEGVSKRFGNGFKDIFLSFLGPMALLGAAMSFIGKMIADNQKKQEDANQAAIDGTNKLMSAEDKYWANKRNNEKKDKATAEEAKTTREETTLQFLQNDPRGRAMAADSGLQGASTKGEFGELLSSVVGRMSRYKPVQDAVQAMIAEDMANNPAAASVMKDTTFSGPQGFSNVIGVGANPVLENLTRQTDIQEQILEHLKATAPSSGITDVDFTKMNPSILETS